MKKWKLILFLFLFLLVGCSTSKKENYSYKEFIVDDKFILMINNTFYKEKDLNIRIDFYFNDNIIKSLERNIYGIKDNDCALDFGKINFEYDYYKINIKYNDSSKSNVFNDIVIKNDDTGQLIKSKIENKSKYNVKLCLAIVFYKNDNIIGIDEEKDILVKNKDIFETYFYYPSESVKNIDFDNYKFFINETYY